MAPNIIKVPKRSKHVKDSGNSPWKANVEHDLIDVNVVGVIHNSSDVSPLVNFINVKRTNFLYECCTNVHFGSFYYYM